MNFTTAAVTEQLPRALSTLITHETGKIKEMIDLQNDAIVGILQESDNLARAEKVIKEAQEIKKTLSGGNQEKTEDENQLLTESDLLLEVLKPLRDSEEIKSLHGSRADKLVRILQPLLGRESDAREAEENETDAVFRAQLAGQRSIVEALLKLTNITKTLLQQSDEEKGIKILEFPERSRSSGSAIAHTEATDERESFEDFEDETDDYISQDDGVNDGEYETVDSPRRRERPGLVSTSDLTSNSAGAGERALRGNQVLFEEFVRLAIERQRWDQAQDVTKIIQSTLIRPQSRVRPRPWPRPWPRPGPRPGPDHDYEYEEYYDSPRQQLKFESSENLRVQASNRSSGNLVGRLPQNKKINDNLYSDESHNQNVNTNTKSDGGFRTRDRIFKKPTRRPQSTTLDVIQQEREPSYDENPEYETESDNLSSNTRIIKQSKTNLIESVNEVGKRKSNGEVAARYPAGRRFKFPSRKLTGRRGAEQGDDRRTRISNSDGEVSITRAGLTGHDSDQAAALRDGETKTASGTPSFANSNNESRFKSHASLKVEEIDLSTTEATSHRDVVTVDTINPVPFSTTIKEFFPESVKNTGNPQSRQENLNKENLLQMLLNHSEKEEPVSTNIFVTPKEAFEATPASVAEKVRSAGRDGARLGVGKRRPSKNRFSPSAKFGLKSASPIGNTGNTNEGALTDRPKVDAYVLPSLQPSQTTETQTTVRNVKQFQDVNIPQKKTTHLEHATDSDESEVVREKIPEDLTPLSKVERQSKKNQRNTLFKQIIRNRDQNSQSRLRQNASRAHSRSRPHLPPRALSPTDQKESVSVHSIPKENSALQNLFSIIASGKNKTEEELSKTVVRVTSSSSRSGVTSSSSTSSSSRPAVLVRPLGRRTSKMKAVGARVSPTANPDLRSLTPQQRLVKKVQDTLRKDGDDDILRPRSPRKKVIFRKKTPRHASQLGGGRKRPQMKSVKVRVRRIPEIFPKVY